MAAKALDVRANTRELLVRARDRGEIAANTDLDVTLDLLYGPIYHRLLHGHAPSILASEGRADRRVRARGVRPHGRARTIPPGSKECLSPRPQP